MPFEIIKPEPRGRLILAISENEARRQFTGHHRNVDEAIATLKNNPFGILHGSDGEIRYNDKEPEAEE
ncbi:MAG: hypothetical protein RSD49_18265 [Hafnia sp.]